METGKEGKMTANGRNYMQLPSTESKIVYEALKRQLNIVFVSKSAFINLKIKIL